MPGDPTRPSCVLGGPRGVRPRGVQALLGPLRSPTNLKVPTLLNARPAWAAYGCAAVGDLVRLDYVA
jgi:hypothetical protein